MKKKITLIAEIGENHLGKINLAKKMILQAKKSGADIIKFQSYNNMCLKKNDPEYKWFKKVSLSEKKKESSFFLLFCLLPNHYATLAYLFSFLTPLTHFFRILSTKKRLN